MEEFVVTDRRRVNGDGQSMVIVDAALRELPSEVRMLESTIREQLRTLTTSELLNRYQFARQAGISFNGARDEYEILGYDRTITTQQYREEYLRGGIAGRIVDALPNATWRGQMELIEDQDPDKITPFEQAWEDQDTRLQIQAKLLRVDKLAGLSTYAVLLIGAGGDLNTELPKARKPEDLLYLTPFSGGGGPTIGQMTRSTSFDADATIREFDVDPQSPRFGLPLFYQLKRTDLTVSLAKPVHWTRIIHIAENLLDDEVYGLPALERVWNLLSDLRKVTGGGAEAFWLRANQGLHLDIDKDMTLPDVKNAVDSLKDQADAYKHQLTRWLRTKGVKAEVLGSDVANFNSPAEAVLTQIAGAKAIPKRILMGSEMGELASSQDRDNWKDQVNGRQTGYAGPYIVRPLVKRLIQYGYLPMPKKGEEEYEVRWPQITTMTEQEKTAGATAWAAVNASQKNAGQGPTFTDSEIREKWADKAPLTDEQKTELAEQQQEKLKQQQEMMKAQGKGPDGRPVDEEVPPGKKKGPDEHDKELAKEVKKKAIQFVKRAAQEHDDELIRVLQDAMETGAVDVVAAIIGLGGTGSGNFGHAGRPGEVGGSGDAGLDAPIHALAGRLGIKTLTLADLPTDIQEGSASQIRFTDANSAPQPGMIDGLEAGINEVRARNPQLYDTVTKNLRIGYVNLNDPHVVASTSPTGTDIVFNSEHIPSRPRPSQSVTAGLIKDLPDGEERIKELYRATAIHELGHVIDIKTGRYRSDLAALMTSHEYNGNDRAFQKDFENFSEYATVSPQELFAESYLAKVVKYPTLPKYLESVLSDL